MKLDRQETHNVTEYRVHARFPLSMLPGKYKGTPDEEALYDRDRDKARQLLNGISDRLKLKLWGGYNYWSGHFSAPKFTTDINRATEMAKLLTEGGFVDVYIEQRMQVFAKLTLAQEISDAV